MYMHQAKLTFEVSPLLNQLSSCWCAIIQLTSATLARYILSIACGRLPLTRWNNRTVLSDPRGKFALLATKAASTTKPLPDEIPELLRNLVQELWWDLSSSTSRTQQEVAYRTLGNERSQLRCRQYRIAPTKATQC